jgi:hypothetical protein
MKKKINVEELNFSVEAQKRFDLLTSQDDFVDWTWKGMAHAFYERFGRPDTEELLIALQLELKK